MHDARQNELDHLIREQRRDDTDRIEPQRIGGGRAVPLEATESASRLDTYLIDAEADPALIYEQEEDDTSHTDWVTELIASLPEKQQDAYHMVMVERMSERDAAAELGISQPSVHDRLERVKAAVAAEAERRGLYR